MARNKKIHAVEEKPTEPASPQYQNSKNAVADLYTGTAEKTQATSPYVEASMQRPYNPDDLYQKRGDYAIYEEMMQDDQVSICMKLKKDMVLASGWDIVTRGNEDIDTEVKEDIERCLMDDCDYPFDDMLEEIISAYEFGFSLTEKVFKKKDDGYLGVKYLRTRHPASWLIHTDDFGKITRFEQRVQSGDLTIEPKSLIHYINQPKFQNPYGTSDLRAAYNAWFTKRQVIKYFAIFLEGAAGAKPVAKYDTNAPKAAVDDLFSAIKSFQAKTALVIPKEIDVEFLEAKGNGDAYSKAIGIFNMFIGRALFIPDLLGFQGNETGGGSYALGKDQIAVFFKHIKRRRENLEYIVNKEIIRPIVLFNHGDMENFPRFKLRPISEEDATEFAKIWLEAVKGKVFKASEEEVNHFRKLTKFPEGEVEFEEMPQAVNDGGNGLLSDDKEDEVRNGRKRGGGNEVKGAGKDKEDEDEIPANARDRDGDGILNEGQYKQAKKIYDPTPGSFSKKVDFKVIESSMDSFRNGVVDESAPIIRRIIRDLGEQIKRKKILERQAPEKVSTLKPKFLGELKAVMKKSMRQAYADAQVIGARELNKTEYRTPLPDEKFLEFVESEAAMFIDDWAGTTTRQARILILQGIKDGTPISKVLDELDLFGTEDATVSIERFARTKFTDVMNRGRLQVFEDSGVVAAYQYSAILDDRTTDICAGLHGKIFKDGDQPVPPMHFNCRSLLVPITKFEQFDIDKKVGSVPIDKFISDNKGDGFSKFTPEKPEVVEQKVEQLKEFDIAEEMRKPGTSVRSETDGLKEIHTYSRKGKDVYRVTVTYSEGRKSVVGYEQQDLGDVSDAV